MLIFTKTGQYIFLLLLSVQVLAQKQSKLNIELFRVLQTVADQAYDTTYLPILIKGDLSSIQSFVEANKGTYKYGVKNIASAELSLSGIRSLLQQPFLQRMEYRDAPAMNLSYDEDSVMLQNNKVLDVHAGGAGLPYPFKGEGVMVGIIDDGFEYKHPDFLNNDLGSRIKNLWDQTSTNPNYFESFYGYGASWTNSEIDSFKCTQAPNSHGSHVMGTAAGNARASGKYIGIAPLADLAAVRISTGSSFLAGFVDAVHYLFEKADINGQPCSINSSVGAYTSGHDGLDLYSQLIDLMLDEKSGRALSQAAGNARTYDFHYQASLQNTISKLWFQRHTVRLKTHFKIYADTSNFNQVNFSLQCMDPSTLQPVAQTAIFNILQNFTFNGSVAQLSQVLWYDALGFPVELEIYADQYEDSYEIYVSINSFSDVGPWQLTTTGTGTFDIWSNESTTGTSNILKNIPVPDYKNPDNEQTIVGFWTCSDKVFTVASYQNRDFMVNYKHDTVALYTNAYPKLGISFFSSLGPSRKGLQKPDITAPGGQVMSASTISYMRDTNNTYLDEDGWHISNRGTSMAAPMVAGAVALYLECKPYADYADIKNALNNSAAYDNFVLQQVFSIPNIHWGYGKLDVYELVKSCIIYGCTDTTALNYSPFATVLDSNACLYQYTASSNLIDEAFKVYPNPFNKSILLEYNYSKLSTNLNANTEVCIYNTLGQLLLRRPIDKAEYSMRIPLDKYPKGSYWLIVKTAQQILCRKALLKH
jgi:subtilisin family serine protease